MSPNAVQVELQRLYDLETQLRVEQFLISDAALAAALGAEPDKTPEQLLIHQQGEELNISLYLAPELLTALQQPNPGNLPQRLTALEGISHFLYLVWRAERDQPCTQLELELQAEVDKFLHASEHHRQQDLRDLHQAHFQRVGYRDPPGSAERELYQEANRLAARYCRGLLKRFNAHPGHPGLKRELRRFYRLPPGAKAGHIDGRAAF